jgi:hypothetical protein
VVKLDSSSCIQAGSINIQSFEKKICFIKIHSLYGVFIDFGFIDIKTTFMFIPKKFKFKKTAKVKYLIV